MDLKMAMDSGRGEQNWRLTYVTSNFFPSDSVSVYKDLGSFNCGRETAGPVLTSPHARLKLSVVVASALPR
jgi:hypothetical protein